MGTRIAAPALGVWRVKFCERRAGLVFILPRAGPWSVLQPRFAQPQFLATIPSLKPKPKRSQTLSFIWSHRCFNRGGPLIFGANCFCPRRGGIPPKTSFTHLASEIARKSASAGVLGPPRATTFGEIG